jgi:hypothetical protein
MNTIKKHLPFIVSVIISGLFLLSAVAKSFPIWAFEKQLVDLGITDWCGAPYLARLIIALEGAIAIAILQKHYLKRFVIPVTILLLVAFCIHLGMQMYEHGAMNGNCGCFGQLIPMTPLEAVIKNIVTIALLIYLYRNVSDKENGEHRFIYLLCIYFFSAFILFAAFPFCPCSKSTSKNPIVVPNITDTVNIDTTVIIQNNDTILQSKTGKDTTAKQVTSKDTSVAKVIAPKPMQSKFGMYNNFEGRTINIDEGKKIVCLFVPGCDHCRDAAKELVKLSKTHKLPQVLILFMNEELFKIPEFFTETKARFPYHVIEDIPTFFKLLGNNATTPGVNYLWNGNLIKSYQGVEQEHFNASEMIKIIESNKP